MFDLNLVRPFLAVYKLGTITKAAESLSLTQPAVSSAIKRFETTLGYPLFVRMGRKIEPTSKAHQLASQLETGLELIDGAVKTDQKLVVYANFVAINLLPEMPNVQLLETPKNEEEVLQDIRLNKADLVIDYSLPREGSFIYEPAFSDEIVFVCDKEHPSIVDEITIEQYLDAEHVTVKLIRQNVQTVDFLSRERLLRKVAIEVRSLSNLLLAIKNTNYVGAAVKTMQSKAEAIGLKVLPLPFETDKVEFEFTYHKKHENNPTHKALREQIKALLNEN